jgi:hypothetical protein
VSDLGGPRGQASRELLVRRAPLRRILARLVQSVSSMNRCLRCHTAISARNAQCPACGWEFSPVEHYKYGDSLTKDVSGLEGLGHLLIHPMSLLMLMLLILPTFDLWSCDPFLFHCFPGLAFFIATIYAYWLYGLSETYQLEPRGRTSMACVVAGFYPYVVVVIPSTLTVMMEQPGRFTGYLYAQISIAIAYFGIVVVLRGFLVREHLLTIQRRKSRWSNGIRCRGPTTSSAS